jgi:3-methylcrotonyl-CoA carboxylase alpha subunit
VALERPFTKVLIANRGEIAVRIARTCRAMGVRTVAVYSDVDVRALHVRECDEAVRLGPAPARDSYLRADAVIAAAVSTGARAVHPGYGFLSENAEFAEACVDAGLAFVGPPARAMRAMGDKIAAKRTADTSGVPIIAGYLGDDQSFGALSAAADRIGYPLLVKAAAGGGGKGMRVVHESAELARAIEGAQREAQAAFGNATIFLEKYLASPRHIEIQVLADSHGTCIHLGERDCSIQRRHQKILEETPSVAIDERLRAEMGAAAVRAAAAVGYVNAGTVEFMLDADGAYYFLEMNTRLQVEHAITEAVVGIDLVREQLWIAAGRPLSLSQADVAARGHAIEARIYAEDAASGFLPSTGRLTTFVVPEGPGVRNDAGVVPGDAVTSDYDPMLAKLIVEDRSRDACIQRLTAALDSYRVGGVATNLPFLRWLVRNDAFRRGETTTGFIDQHFAPAMLAREGDDELAVTCAAAVTIVDVAGSRSADPWRRLGGWRLASSERTVTFERPIEASIRVRWDPSARSWRCTTGTRTALVSALGAGEYLAVADDIASPFCAWRARHSIALAFDRFHADCVLAAPPAVADAARGHKHSAHGIAGSIAAPMSGKIVKVDVAPGVLVEAHQVLVVMEAMKMEHSIAAPHGGKVLEVTVAQGDAVGAGDVLVRIEQ